MAKSKRKTGGPTVADLTPRAADIRPPTNADCAMKKSQLAPNTDIVRNDLTAARGKP